MGELKETLVVLQLANRSVKTPQGVLEDVIVDIKGCCFPVDFLILDIPIRDDMCHAPIILGRPFLSTAKANIDYENGIINIKSEDKHIALDVFRSTKFPINEKDELEEVEELETCIEEVKCVQKMENQETDIDCECLYLGQTSIEPLAFGLVPMGSSLEQPPDVELKPLSASLKYVFLGSNQTLPVIISATLTEEQEKKIVNVLRKHKGEIGWMVADLKGVNSDVCMHHIYLEENAKPSREM